LQSYGRILLVSSGAGRGASCAGTDGYAAAKAGLLGVVLQLAREAGEFGITANSVAPGLIDGPRGRVASDNDTDDGRQAVFDGVVVKRLGTATEIASAILYFVLPQAAYTTGRTLLVDGGHLMF
jgi:3-oxoacyl-[acyl-carrier protein] reductase